jgi:hypothetical protein
MNTYEHSKDPKNDDGFPILGYLIGAVIFFIWVWMHVAAGTWGP